MACSAALLCLPVPLAAAARWAVIVGISDYEAFADEVSGDLRGPVNDARAIHEHSSAVELPFGGMMVPPTAKYRLGELVVVTGQGTGLTGTELGLTIRLGGRR